jgi:hypothetical protein
VAHGANKLGAGIPIPTDRRGEGVGGGHKCWEREVTDRLLIGMESPEGEGRG